MRDATKRHSETEMIRKVDIYMYVCVCITVDHSSKYKKSFVDLIKLKHIEIGLARGVY